MAHQRRYPRRRTPDPILINEAECCCCDGADERGTVTLEWSYPDRHFVRTYGEAGTDPNDPEWRPNFTMETDAAGNVLPCGVIMGELRGYLTKGAASWPKVDGHDRIGRR